MRILIATSFVLLILTVGKMATSIDASGSGSTQHASVHRFRPQIANRDLYPSDAGWKPLVGPNRSTQFAPEGNYPTRTSFIAFWQPVSGATGYHVDVATDPTFTNYVNGYRDVAAGNVTHLPVQRLVPGTTYYYRVRPDSVPLVSPETRIAATSANAGLTINATFDSSITSNPNAGAVEAMINRAIAIYETLFTDPVTIEILFRYSTTAPDGHPLGPGATARSDNPFYIILWDTYIAALRTDAKTGNDAVANASLPGTALSSDIRPSSANGRAVGLDTPPAMFADGSVGNGGPYDGIVTLNSTAPFGFTRPVASNDFDAQRETEHEINEVMGLGSAANTAYFHTQDLFSWSSPGIRNISPNGTRYFSINGGNTNIVNFNQDPNGDPGDWLSGPCPQAQPYVQNASDCTGQSSDVTATSPEGVSLDVIGYALVSPPAQLGNISTRVFVQTGDNIVIGGFIITGSGQKRVIVRAIGPSLVNHGITNPLQNPTLELHDHTGAVIASDDNWMNAPNRQEIINSGLAPSNNLESAILTSLNPGAYTAFVRGVNNGTGIALVEGYDLDPAAGSKLGNMSTRALVQTGNNVMIGGFIITGSGQKRVIVRAIGPSLAQPGITNPLQDPTLELHNGNGAVIAFNDNWKDTQQAEITATSLAPTNDKESAILRTLAPGNYTAIVRGKNNTIGVALVEVYGLN
jgi:hypothetical protein